MIWLSNDHNYMKLISNINCVTGLESQLLGIVRAGKRSGPPNGLFNRFTMGRIGAVNFR